jgi:hypothetical protein
MLFFQRPRQARECYKRSLQAPAEYPSHSLLRFHLHLHMLIHEGDDDLCGVAEREALHDLSTTFRASGANWRGQIRLVKHCQ